MQNFGVKANGQSGGTNASVNRVVGVTSWGFVSSKPKILATSTPGTIFTSLIDDACEQAKGNCD